MPCLKSPSSFHFIRVWINPLLTKWRTVNRSRQLMRFTSSICANSLKLHSKPIYCQKIAASLRFGLKEEYIRTIGTRARKTKLISTKLYSSTWQVKSKTINTDTSWIKRSVCSSARRVLRHLMTFREPCLIWNCSTRILSFQLSSASLSIYDQVNESAYLTLITNLTSCFKSNN